MNFLAVLDASACSHYLCGKPVALWIQVYNSDQSIPLPYQKKKMPKSGWTWCAMSWQVLLQGWPLWPLKGLNLQAEVDVFLVVVLGGIWNVEIYICTYCIILYHTVMGVCNKLFLKSPSPCLASPILATPILASQDLIWPVIYKPCIASSIPTGRSMLQLFSFPPTNSHHRPSSGTRAGRGRCCPKWACVNKVSETSPVLLSEDVQIFYGKLPIVEKSSEKDIHLLRGPNKLLYMSEEIPRCGRAIAGRAKSPYFWQCYYISSAHSVFYQYAI